MTIPEELYDQILANGPSSETLFIILSKLKEAGQHKRVIEECIRAISTYPRDISIRRLLAETYFEAGMLPQAEAELHKVIYHLDHFAPLYVLQARLYQKENRMQEAVRSLKTYLAHRPDDHEALHLLETLGPPLEMPLESIPSAAEAIEPVEATVHMEREAPEERKEQAEDTEEDALPELATPTLAEVYVNQGQIMEAMNIYERILAQKPEDSASRRRVEELKAMTAMETPVEAKPGEKEREKKEKIISTLETWLEEMRKLPKDTLSA